METPKGLTSDLMSPMPTSWSPRMTTWTWSCDNPETAATLARSIADLVRGASVRWEGLPGWQTRFHVMCKRKGGGAEVGLLLWPEPESE